jgi:hypothetical protein
MAQSAPVRTKINTKVTQPGPDGRHGASPAELLGTVAEHYTPETGMEEIAIWRAAHGGWLDPLVQAIRDCPFVSRRVAMLQTLVKAVPEGDDLLAGLLRDPELGPVVLLAEKQRYTS